MFKPKTPAPQMKNQFPAKPPLAGPPVIPPPGAGEPDADDMPPPKMGGGKKIMFKRKSKY